MANPSLHYIGSNTGSLRDHTACTSVWNGIIRQHTGTYRPSPAYNFGVCNAHGLMFEGRGWGMDSAANGVDDDPEVENLGSRALLCLVGPDDHITDTCKRAIGRWAEDAVVNHGMSWPLRPHSNYVSTQCPGDNLREVIEEINAGKWREEDTVTKEEMDYIIEEASNEARDKVVAYLNLVLAAPGQATGLDALGDVLPSVQATYNLVGEVLAELKK